MKNKKEFKFKTDFFQKWNLIIGGILFIFLIPAGFSFSFFSIIIFTVLSVIFLLLVFSFIIKTIIISIDKIEVLYPYSIFKNNRIISIKEIKEVKYFRRAIKGRSQLKIYCKNMPNIKIYGVYAKFNSLLSMLYKLGIKISWEDSTTGWRMDYDPNKNPDDLEEFQINL